jgi:PAS domain S-box-containing protein
MATGRILVIDDDAYIRNACTEFLRSEGYTVASADSGEKGVAMLSESTYELVLTDYKMPGMDGLEVLKHVKGISPKTDVIIITAHGTIENAVKAMRQGAYDYITKDFDIIELELIVKRVFEKQKLSAQVSELKEVINLYEASKAINSLMGLNELLNLILQLLCDTLSADGGSILLYSYETHDLRVHVALGPHKDKLMGKKMMLSDMGGEYSELRETDISLGGAIRNDIKFKLIKDIEGIQSSITVPLQRKGNLFGVINLYRQKQETKFTQHEEYLLSIFAAEAAVAIENINLFNSLEKEKEELNAIFTNMADGSITLNAGFGIVRMNQSAEVLLGINFIDNEGKNIIECISEFKPSVSWKAITVNPERIMSFELSRSKGKALYLGVVVTKTFDQDNNPLAQIWVLRDITEEKREGKHKNDFLALITHKFKTPLTSIIGYSSLLVDRAKNMDERTIAGLKTIKKQSDLLDELVESLLKFTLLDSEFTQLTPEVVSLKGLLEVCVHKFSTSFMENNVNLTIEENIENLPPLFIDRKKISEALDNLVKNAVQFNKKEKKEIHISAQVLDGNFITLNIKDNGDGIPSEEYQKIFKKFYQIDEYDTGQIKGMGLGLALVERMVTLHGGKVWVKSVIGEGSTFSITLPVKN